MTTSPPQGPTGLEARAFDGRTFAERALDARTAETPVSAPGNASAASATPAAPSTPAAPAAPATAEALDAPDPPAARRGPADPVRALIHRHRELCERAVDPLEIAAGLEAHGVTDRTAARFRHRDVFSLAEELYARVPRGTDAERPLAAPGPERTVGRRGADAPRNGA
ncbi:hypothetical protein AB0M39_19365, partial [Streptomyces sp. NPDC051907]